MAITSLLLEPFARLVHLTELHLTRVSIPELEQQQQEHIPRQLPTNILRLDVFNLPRNSYTGEILRQRLCPLLPCLEELNCNEVEISLWD